MAAIVYQNLADNAVVTASSWIAAAPPITLQNVHVTRRWQGDGGSVEYILAVWSTAQLIDTIGVFGLAGIFLGTQRALSSAATTRIRISSADVTGLTGDLFDSLQVAGTVREAYGALLSLHDTPMSARAVRIDLAETGAEVLSAGRLVVGLRNSFKYNFSFGWSFGYSDLSRKRKSSGGLSFIDREERFRVLDLRFGAVDPTDRYGFVQEVDRLNGIATDILFITDEDSSDLDRDCVWGLIQDMSPPSQPSLPLFRKAYRIEERL